MIQKLKDFILKHKIISLVIVVFIFFIIISRFWSSEESIKYITQVPRMGDVSISISGSGQVSSLKTLDIFSEVSGNIVGVYVDAGDNVSKNEILFKIDQTEQLRNVKNAELSLEKAQLQLQEIKEPVDALTLLQAENSLTDAIESKEKAEANLTKSYEDGFNSVSNVFLTLPTLMRSMENLLFDKDLDDVQENITWYINQTDFRNEEREKALIYREKVYSSYNEARLAYTNNFNNYKTLSRSSDKESIENLINETYETTVLISDMIKEVDNYISFVQDSMELRGYTVPTASLTHKSNLNSYMSTMNSQISSMLSTKNNIEDNKDGIIGAERNIATKELSLENIKKGATDLEIRTQELAVEMAEQDLVDAKEAYNNCLIRAPFSGTISSVKAVLGDNASSNAVMGSVITDAMIATITLNEVDIANIETGQEVNLTFDALDDTSIKGEVSEIDAIGTVSQGVVSYNVTISFETENKSIKPGMSITADIIIDSAKNVLTVPSSAVKTMRGESFVEVLNNELIERKVVEVGLADDILVEIKNGLNDTDNVIISTITTTKTTTNNTKNTERTMVNMGGQMPQGGEMMRMTR